MKTLIRPALVLFILLSLVTGLLYPLAVTGIARLAFPDEAAGSLIIKDGKAVGSALIGQNFAEPGHFWGRPSATAPQPYNAVASSGSNLGPLNPALFDAIKGRVEALRTEAAGTPVPVDLVTASASGLDPEISPAAALWQIPRIARARHLPEAQLRTLVDAHTEPRTWRVFGEARVNVLKLNLALDALHG
jgi:K+-transporting ATPase ATPase C chain